MPAAKPRKPRAKKGATVNEANKQTTTVNVRVGDTAPKRKRAPRKQGARAAAGQQQQRQQPIMVNVSAPHPHTPFMPGAPYFQPPVASGLGPRAAPAFQAAAAPVTIPNALRQVNAPPNEVGFVDPRAVSPLTVDPSESVGSGLAGSGFGGIYPGIGDFASLASQSTEGLAPLDGSVMSYRTTAAPPPVPRPDFLDRDIESLMRREKQKEDDEAEYADAFDEAGRQPFVTVVPEMATSGGSNILADATASKPNPMAQHIPPTPAPIGNVTMTTAEPVPTTVEVTPPLSQMVMPAVAIKDETPGTVAAGSAFGAVMAANPSPAESGPARSLDAQFAATARERLDQTDDPSAAADILVSAADQISDYRQDQEQMAAEQAKKPTPGAVLAGNRTDGPTGSLTEQTREVILPPDAPAGEKGTPDPPGKKGQQVTPEGPTKEEALQENLEVRREYLVAFPSARLKADGRPEKGVGWLTRDTADLRRKIAEKGTRK